MDAFEVAVMAPVDVLRLAQSLVDEGRPFAAHEVFESAWKSADEVEANLWKGLAQIAVGLTHAQRGNATGAVTVLRRGAEYVAAYDGAVPFDIDVRAIVSFAEELADEIERFGAPDPLPSMPRLTRDQSDQSA